MTYALSGAQSGVLSWSRAPTVDILGALVWLAKVLGATAGKGCDRSCSTGSVPWWRVILNCATSASLDRMDDSGAMKDSAKPLQRVVLGLTGGIAAYKAAELTRLLVKEGIAVDVVMTEAATRFIAPMTLQALSGNPVLTDLWESGSANAMGHIDLSRHADAIVVAPASADFIAKLAHGLADDLLSALCLARDCPLLIAPAMNVQMWGNAATQRNVAQLRQDGIEILGPGERRSGLRRIR